jgi:sarcosine oxidase
MSVDSADVIVIGLGAVGAATLHALARSGVRAIGIDRYHPPHAHGSSHGESRISRLAVGEGPAYAPLVRRSHDIWCALEAESGEALFLQTGGLIMGPSEGAALHHGKDDFVRRTIAVAAANGIAHEVLQAAEITARFPQFRLRGDEIACYEPTAGMVFPEACIDVQLRLAHRHGAELRLGTRVTSVRQQGNGVEVSTDMGVLHAASAVLTAGPWLPELGGATVANAAQVHRQTLHWFEPQNAAEYAPERFPVFIWMHGETEEDYFYGFPVVPGSSGLKVASERYSQTVTPETVERIVSAEESRQMHARHVAGRLPGVSAHCLRAAACLYTVTPDSGFIVDRMPGAPAVVVASACSGHGFKHSAAVGEILAHAVTDNAGHQLPAAFSLQRYSNGGQTARG